MFSLRNTPIRRKVTIITMMTTLAALVMAGAGILLVDSLLFRRSLQRDLTALARIIADGSTAALAFNDPDTAAQTLASLRWRTHVQSACTYRLNGSVLAAYQAPGALRCPPPDTAPGIHFSGQNLIVSEPITVGGSRMGTLTMLCDTEQTTERLRLYGATVFCVLLAASLVALLLAWYLRALIVKPISRLVDTTRSVAESGDYSIRARKVTHDELGTLVDRFNEMLAGIQSRDNELKKALGEREIALCEADNERERFRFMAESMPQKIFAAGPGGESVYLNKQWMEFTGLPLEQIKGWGWSQFIHPSDLEESMRVWKHAIATGDPLQMMSRFRRADGVYRWHLNRARAMRNAAGEITLWIGSSTDIHEQKEREEELRRANEDLQQFAYSASHDLQEPIRNVAIYSEIVVRRYRDLLDEEGRQYLEFMREGGRRLARLVADLLAYTRASTVDPVPAPVPASAALESSIADLAEAIREAHATLTYDRLPEVYMSEAHLRQIFQNLVGNALKYRNEEAPRIHVSATERGDLWCFSVQDNGIGIDPQYKEKIFGLFKRLDHDPKLGGTGIGLAICQRLVERYGGRIWVESESGKGATFFFTVQQRPEWGRAGKFQSAGSGG
ncbi:MAG TPA: ATP-binding protein [Bryobacteraceae bacterium]|nr:ATP-binding protein [Bryobacteraceae bacterium]